MSMKCSCGSEDLKIKDNGPHKELFCGCCLTFIKFLNKKQAERMAYLLRERENPLICYDPKDWKPVVRTMKTNKTQKEWRKTQCKK